MPSLRPFPQKLKPSCVLAFAAITLLASSVLLPLALAQDAPSIPSPASSAPEPEPAQQPQPTASTAPPSLPPGSRYDKAIFLKPIPADVLAPLKQFDGAPTKTLMHDKQFRKLMHDAIPNCEFHYGRDMPLSDALDMVMQDSPDPVTVRDGRYLTLSGNKGPYLGGRAMVWIDLQDGIVLGAFYFHPTNGEPTPSVNVFSRQVKEKTIAMSQLPPAFVDDLIQWSTQTRIAPVTTRYFLTGLNKKILLEHDEDYCVHADGTVEPANSGCEQMDADAADIDVNAAYYLEQVNYATNATAWMITGADQEAWLQVRMNTCGIGPDPLGCRIRMTRERTHVIVSRPPQPHMPAGRR